MLNCKQLIGCWLLAAAVGSAAPTVSTPRFDEVYRLLSTNLDGVSREQLNRAAVEGLVDKLSPSVRLIDAPGAETPEKTNAAGIASVRLFDGAFAYIRLGSVNAEAGDSFSRIFQEMSKTNHAKIKGVVLDLRFASGTDYAAAAKVADCFFNSTRPLLNWRSGSAHATEKNDAILAPVAVLVNSRTCGAAEALAAVLRDSGAGLLLGEPTSGRASIFKEFPLANGDKLRVAVANVTVGAGTVLTNGLNPDIPVEASLPDEEAWLRDPYKVLHPEEVAKTNDTNAPPQPARPRFNEAELVREHAAGEDQDEFTTAGPEADDQTVPVVADPVLARALDLLKGLAVIQPVRPS